jgi:hypothetical protein
MFAILERALNSEGAFETAEVFFFLLLKIIHLAFSNSK